MNSMTEWSKGAWLAAVIAVVTTAVPAGAASGASSGPVVRLFPTTVLEDIRETSAVAAAMENNLAEVIRKMDMQQSLYVESLCEGAEGDQGCERIARQIGVSYLEMLDVMNERLPQMEASVANTRSGLEKRLREELGLRTTPTSLQDNLLGQSPAVAAAAQPVLRGRSGVRLSDRFKQYHDLVASGSNGQQQSLAVVAADIYLDMEDAAQLIAATRQEIGRAALMEQLNQSFGVITPEMASVVGGVRKILFGEGAADGFIAAPPDLIGEAEYVSPLAM